MSSPIAVLQPFSASHTSAQNQPFACANNSCNNTVHTPLTSFDNIVNENFSACNTADNNITSSTPVTHENTNSNNSPSHNMHPMITPLKAGIFKPKLYIVSKCYF